MSKHPGDSNPFPSTSRLPGSSILRGFPSPSGTSDFSDPSYQLNDSAHKNRQHNNISPSLNKSFSPTRNLSGMNNSSPAAANKPYHHGHSHSHGNMLFMQSDLDLASNPMFALPKSKQKPKLFSHAPSNPALLNHPRSSSPLAQTLNASPQIAAPVPHYPSKSSHISHPSISSSFSDAGSTKSANPSFPMAFRSQSENGELTGAGTFANFANISNNHNPNFHSGPASSSPYLKEASPLLTPSDPAKLPNRSLSPPEAIPFRPTSRGSAGVNFSRPSTFYKLENTTSNVHDTTTLAMPSTISSSSVPSIPGALRQSSVSSEDTYFSSGPSPVRSINSDFSASSNSIKKPLPASSSEPNNYADYHQSSLFEASTSHNRQFPNRRVDHDNFSNPNNNCSSPIDPRPDLEHWPNPNNSHLLSSTLTTPPGFPTQTRSVSDSSSVPSHQHSSSNSNILVSRQLYPHQAHSRSHSHLASQTFNSNNTSNIPNWQSHGPPTHHNQLHASEKNTVSSINVLSRQSSVSSALTKKRSDDVFSANASDTTQKSDFCFSVPASPTTPTPTLPPQSHHFTPNGLSPHSYSSSTMETTEPSNSIDDSTSHSIATTQDPQRLLRTSTVTSTTSTTTTTPSLANVAHPHLDQDALSSGGKKPFAQQADRHKSVLVFTEDINDDGDTEPLPPMPSLTDVYSNIVPSNSFSPQNSQSSTSGNYPSITSTSTETTDQFSLYQNSTESDTSKSNNGTTPNASQSLSSTNTPSNPNKDDSTNNNNKDDNNNNTSLTVAKPKKKPKICFACKEPISGHFVRALGCIYHMECFCCFDCGSQCSAKFFPVESPTAIPETNNLIPLCEHDYFRRQDLLCCVCDGALRGSYITALGKKYHVEHFTCSLCSTVFGSDDSYYEHEDNIYCRYHYSTLYAAKCEGCKTAILKQFVEVFRGGREQQWHPECYMINKFWNVMISPSKLKVYEGEDTKKIELIPSEDEKAANTPTTEDQENSTAASTTAVTPFNTSETVSSKENPSDPSKKDASSTSRELQTASPDPETRDQVLHTEQDTERKAFHIWSVLCGYEEATAACISDMLQFATSSRYNDALIATARLVTKIEILLSAIDTLIAHIDPLLSTLHNIEEATPETLAEETEEFLNLMETVRNAGFTQLRKEPKTLCKKIVAYMSLLSKNRDKSVKEPGPSHDLLDSVTGMAHYLKLLIRYGLSNSLRYDRAFPNSNRLVEFLEKVDTHNTVIGNPLEALSVSSDANDKCLVCGISTEDDCAILDESKLWHLDCLACARCKTPLGSCVRDARYLVKEKTVVCINCLSPDAEYLDNFVVVTKLNQFIYLVKIALARLKLVLKTYDKRDAKAAAAAASGRPVSDSRKSSVGGISVSLEDKKLPLQPSAPAQQKQIQSSVHSPISSSISAVSSQVSSQQQQKPLPQPQQQPSQSQQQSSKNVETNYMTTLKDIRKLRTNHLNQRLSESSRRARRSRILDVPDGEHGLLGKNDSSTFLPVSGRMGDPNVYHAGAQSDSRHLPGGQLATQNEQFGTKTGHHLASAPNHQQHANSSQFSSVPSKSKQTLSKQSAHSSQQQHLSTLLPPDPNKSQSRRGSANKEDYILENVPFPSSDLGSASNSLHREITPQGQVGGHGKSQPSSPLQHSSSFADSGLHSAPATVPSFKSFKGKKFAGGPKRRRKLTIEEDPIIRSNYTQLDRTTDLLKSEKSLILDDIPRIVAAEQARELRPNAYRHRRHELGGDDDVTVQEVNEKRGLAEKYISELSASELFIVRHISVSLLFPLVSQWYTMDDLQDVINVRKAPSIWEKFGKAFNLNGGDRSASDDRKRRERGKPVEKTGVFGVSLEQQVEQYGVDSTFGVGPVPLRIPAFVDECISAMRQMDMSVEGVFRKNGNIRRSKELAAMVDNNPDYAGMFTDENPVQLAALFKRYLRELPDCLMSFKLQKLWVNSQEIADIDDRTRVMHLACCILPSAHRDVMEVLFYFLFWTASFSHIDEESGSKMDIHNLSTVITPNILYAKHKEGSPPDSSEGYFLAIEAIDTLIKEYDRFSKVPQEVLVILNNEFSQASSDITSKEIFARIGQYKNTLKESASSASNVTNSNGTVSATGFNPAPAVASGADTRDKNDDARYGLNNLQSPQQQFSSNKPIRRGSDPLSDGSQNQRTTPAASGKGLNVTFETEGVKQVGGVRNVTSSDGNNTTNQANPGFNNSSNPDSNSTRIHTGADHNADNNNDDNIDNDNDNYRKQKSFNFSDKPPQGAIKGSSISPLASTAVAGDGGGL